MVFFRGVVKIAPPRCGWKSPSSDPTFGIKVEITEKGFYEVKVEKEGCWPSAPEQTLGNFTFPLNYRGKGGAPTQTGRPSSRPGQFSMRRGGDLKWRRLTGEARIETFQIQEAAQPRRRRDPSFLVSANRLVSHQLYVDALYVGQVNGAGLSSAHLSPWSDFRFDRKCCRLCARRPRRRNMHRT